MPAVTTYPDLAALSEEDLSGLCGLWALRPSQFQVSWSWSQDSGVGFYSVLACHFPVGKDTVSVSRLPSQGHWMYQLPDSAPAVLLFVRVVGPRGEVLAWQWCRLGSTLPAGSLAWPLNALRFSQLLPISELSF